MIPIQDSCQAAALLRSQYGLGPLDEFRHAVKRIDGERIEIAGRDLSFRVAVELMSGTVIAGIIRIDQLHKLMEFSRSDVSRCISPAFLGWLDEALERHT